MVIDLPRPAGDVLVSNPQIADAVLRTSTRLYLIGVKLGQANVFLFDHAGKQIASFDVYVEADLGSLNQLLAEAIPNGYVRAEALNGSIVLRGQVASSSDSGKASQIDAEHDRAPRRIGHTTARLQAPRRRRRDLLDADLRSDSGPGIVNLLTITGEEQVALRVTIAEVQRQVVKQLGINIKAILRSGNFGVGTNFDRPARAIVASRRRHKPDHLPVQYGDHSGRDRRRLVERHEHRPGDAQALEETRMLKTLAEPTLTAVSGETANFLAGGEFPVPVSGDNGQIDVQFKQFGVNLAFTPVVLAAGRIS